MVNFFQAEECLKQEKERVSHYLQSSSEQKLMKVCCLSSVQMCLWSYFKREINVGKFVFYLKFHLIRLDYGIYFGIFLKLVSFYYELSFFFFFFVEVFCLMWFSQFTYNLTSSFCRRWNMSCCLYMKAKCSRRNILDVMLCLRITRYGMRWCMPSTLGPFFSFSFSCLLFCWWGIYWPCCSAFWTLRAYVDPYYNNKFKVLTSF